MISIISGMRRPKRSPSKPKINAPTGRIASVMVIAYPRSATLVPKSCAIGTITNVSRKKSNASSVQPRKQAMNVLRWS